MNAFPPGQVSDLDTAIIAACDDLFPDHSELFFAQFHVNCLSCNASGKVSAALFDTMLSINLENDTIDLPQMIADRAPRLALDREDVGFSHASDCYNQDQQNNEEIEGCLMFTLKITSPIEQLPIATKALNLLGQLFNVPTLSANPVSQSFIIPLASSLFKESRHTISLSLSGATKDRFLFMTTSEAMHGSRSNN